MSDRPQTWHYGLVARWWAEFNEADPDELAFYRGVVERDGQPALDLGCGTGRLLVPLLQAGLDVDGCDISPDMLAQCREQAARDGLSPALYQQAIHELDLPRRYRTIYICDSFGIGGQREQDLEALRRCHRHLAPGGTLVFSHELPYEDRRPMAVLAAGAAAEVPRGMAATGDAQARRRWRRNGVAHPAGRPRSAGAAADAADPGGALARGSTRGRGGAHVAGHVVLPQRTAADAGPGGIHGRGGAGRLQRRASHGADTTVVFVARKAG